jgi:hypothetical protein
VNRCFCSPGPVGELIRSAANDISMRISLVFVLTFATCLPASARIGESLTQIEKRFGKAEKVETLNGRYKVSIHTHNGIKVHIEYIDGTSAKEAYSLVTEEESKAILANIGGFKPMPPEDPDFPEPIFVYKNDKGVRAVFPDYGILLFDDGRFDALKKQEAEEKAKGPVGTKRIQGI